MRPHFKHAVLVPALLLLTGGVALAQDTDKEVAELADRIALDVAKIRGLELRAKVKKGIQNREQLGAFMLEELEKEMPDDVAVALSKTYAKLGFTKPGLDLKSLLVNLYTEQVAGFYNPERKELFLIGPGGGPEQEMVMAHELVHAIQDQHFDLYRLHKAVSGNDHRALALTALIEGDATLAMTAYLMKNQLGIDMPVERLPDVGMMFRMQAQLGAAMGGGEAMKKAPKVITENMLFGYTDGASFCQKLVKKGGGYRVITDAFGDLPETTEQILHPEKYFDREHPESVTFGKAGDAKGWTELYNNVMGELNTRLMFNETIGETRAKRAAAGWGGDSFQVVEQKDGTLALLWVWVGDTVKDAEEFAQAYNTHARKLATRTLKVKVEGKRVLVLDGVESDAFWALLQNAEVETGYAPIPEAGVAAAPAGDLAAMVTTMTVPKGWSERGTEAGQLHVWSGPHGERMFVRDEAFTAKGGLKAALANHRDRIVARHEDVEFRTFEMVSERRLNGWSSALTSWEILPEGASEAIVIGELHLWGGPDDRYIIASVSAPGSLYSSAVKAIRGANQPLDQFVTTLETGGFREGAQEAPKPAPKAKPKKREPELF